MRSSFMRASILTAALVMLTQAGCRHGASGASFLSLFGLSQKPVVVALVARPDVLDPFTPHEKLRQAMSKALDRPVGLDLCLPIQLEANMRLGFYDVAIVTPACYASIADSERFNIIAVAVDNEGVAARPALLVARADSDIQKIEDLKGKRVAFGPSHDARTHQAGLALLKEHGLKKSDLKLQLLPIAGSLKQYAKMNELALAVQNGEMDAGFIDQRAFDAFQAQAESEDVPSRAAFRIIAQTKPAPDTLVIQSPKAKPEVVEGVVEFLLAAGEKNPDALRPLLLSAYQKPTPELCAWVEDIKTKAPEETPTEE